jgi:5-methylcytosine-specific restriction endonuclease McrA
MILGNDFIFSALLIIVALLPLYIYRKKVFKFYYIQKDIRQFKKEVQLFLKEHYPKIVFDFSIYKRIAQEKDFRIQESLIIENLSTQFLNYEYEVQTQKTVNPDILWTTYEQESVKPKGKTPQDLQRRKEIAFRRDQQKCIRCGTSIKLENSYIHYVKKLENAGTFHLENIAITCIDCNRILSDNPPKQIKDLHIYGLLMKKALF